MEQITLEMARLEAGFTVEEIAQKLKTTSDCIMEYERNNINMPIGGFIKLCRLYNVTLDDIYIGDTRRFNEGKY